MVSRRKQRREKNQWLRELEEHRREEEQLQQEKRESLAHHFDDLDYDGYADYYYHDDDYDDYLDNFVYEEYLDRRNDEGDDYYDYYYDKYIDTIPPGTHVKEKKTGKLFLKLENGYYANLLNGSICYFQVYEVERIFHV